MATRTNIPNPYSNLPVRERACLQIHVDPKVQGYLEALTGRTPGAISAIIATMVSNFVKETEKRKIPANFDPENESRLIELLADLTFKRRKATT